MLESVGAGVVVSVEGVGVFASGVGVLESVGAGAGVLESVAAAGAGVAAGARALTAQTVARDDVALGK